MVQTRLTGGDWLLCTGTRPLIEVAREKLRVASWAEGRGMILPRGGCRLDRGRVIRKATLQGKETE